MAFASSLRRVLKPSSILQSHFTSIRSNSTLTSPKLFVSVVQCLLQYPLDVSPLNVPQYKYWDKAFILTSKEDMQRKDMPGVPWSSLLHFSELGLSRLTTDEKLREAFSAFGQLLEAKVVVDRASGRSKGFAFVTYAFIEEAEQARKDMNAKFLDGWVIFVDPAKPREPRPPPQPESQPSETGFRVNKTIGWCG
ncbi:unnamed protein product [Camellia sinensis]